MAGDYKEEEIPTIQKAMKNFSKILILNLPEKKKTL